MAPPLTILDRMQTGLRWTLYALTGVVYVAFAALIVLVFGGFLYAAVTGLLFA